MCCFISAHTGVKEPNLICSMEHHRCEKKLEFCLTACTSELQLHPTSPRLWSKQNLSPICKTKTHLLPVSIVYLDLLRNKDLCRGLTNSISTGMFEFSLDLYQHKPSRRSRKKTALKLCQVRGCVSIRWARKSHSSVFSFYLSKNWSSLTSEYHWEK